jgi:hypothetical protein
VTWRGNRPNRVRLAGSKKRETYGVSTSLHTPLLKTRRPRLTDGLVVLSPSRCLLVDASLGEGRTRDANAQKQRRNIREGGGRTASGAEESRDHVRSPFGAGLQVVGRSSWCFGPLRTRRETFSLLDPTSGATPIRRKGTTSYIGLRT